MTQLTQEERSEACKIIVGLEEKYGLKKAAQILVLASMAAAVTAEHEERQAKTTKA